MVRGASLVRGLSGDSLADLRAQKAQEEEKAEKAKREAEAKQQEQIAESERVARAKQQEMTEQKRLLRSKEQQIVEQNRMVQLRQRQDDKSRLATLRKKKEQVRSTMRLTKQGVEGAESEILEARLKGATDGTGSLAAALASLASLGDLLRSRRDNSSDDGGGCPDCDGRSFNASSNGEVDQIQRETVQFESPANINA